jgi:hypothetical protein
MAAFRKFTTVFSTALLMVTAIGVTPALAHRNPSTCSGTGVAIALDPFEDRGFCSISAAPCTHENEGTVCTQAGETCLLNSVGADSISQCQTIFYQATLAGFPGKCAFSGGSLTITLPDASVVDVTPAGGIPCIGGNATPAPPCNNPPVVSVLVPYSIKPADVAAGSIVASTGYTNGTTHDTTNDTPGGESGSTAKTNFVNSCNDNNKCTTDTCDPNAIGTDACTNTPVVCNDNNACTTEACNTATGACDTTNTTTCNDNNACTTEACNTTTGTCQTSATTTCDDGNACTTEACNTTTGTCQTSATTTCDDGNACTTESCNTSTGVCQTTFTQTCNDGNACTTEACNSTSGACETSHTTTCNDNNACTTEACNTTSGTCDTTSTKTCTDNNACTTESCNSSNGACETSHTTTCNDNNACTSESCNSTSGACQTTNTVVCNDNNSCTDDSCNTSTGQCSFVDNGTCKPIICRTPGFWGTHGTVTNEVIDAAGGTLTVCGASIKDNPLSCTVGSKTSPLEAICVSPLGDIRLQLVRQMTSMALGCEVSGISPDCSGNPGLSDLFSDCTKACLGDPTATRSIGDCESEVDCFNNGGCVDPATGLCGTCPSGNCEQRNLPSPFNTPGADSPQQCNGARKNNCTVVSSTAKSYGVNQCNVTCP